MVKDKIIQGCYLCPDCAKKNGGILDCAGATGHMGQCQLCEEETHLLHSGDFKWPWRRQYLWEWD